MRLLFLSLVACGAAPVQHGASWLDEAPQVPAETGASAAASSPRCGAISAFENVWEAASWAEATQGSEPNLVQLDGEPGLRVPVRFAGEAYAQGAVSQDWNGSFADCGALSMRVGLPQSAPTSLTAKVILFLDGQWVEGEDATPLVPGTFVEVHAPFFGGPVREAYAHATGFSLKIEGHGTSFNGMVFVTRVALKALAGSDTGQVRSVGTFGGFMRGNGPDIPGRNGFLTFVANNEVNNHALVWPKLGAGGSDLTFARLGFGGTANGHWDFGDWVTLRATSAGVRAILSRAFPAVRYVTSADSMTVDAPVTDVTWVSNGQITTSSANISLSTMSEPWMIVNTTTAPLLLTFEHRPQSLVFGASGLRVGGAVNTVNAMPLFGVKRGAPENPVIEARAWVARLAAFPVSLDESYDVGASDVRITNRYTYETYADDWGTQPERIAPLPPLVAQAFDRGYPVQTTFTRTAVRTFYGPFVYQPGESASFTLPLPNGLDRLELPVRVKNDPSVSAIASAYDRIVLDQMPTQPADFYLDNNDRAGSVLCEAAATHTPGSPERIKASTVGPKLIEKSWLTSSLQTLTEPVSGQTYLNNAKYWASNEPFDKEWYTGRQLAALGVCAETQDLSIARAVWPRALGLYRYDRIFFDWALGSALSSVFGFTALIDGIYFAWEGMQSVARLARKVGDEATYRDAAYRAARQQVAVFMLWHHSKWVRDIDYGIGHISGAKLAPAAIETRFAFDGYVEDFGGATLELQSLWQNVNAFAYDVLPQFAFYRDYGIAPALETLMFDVTPVLHPQMFDGNVMDTTDNRYYGALNTAFYMQTKAAMFHVDPAPFFAAYKASEGTLASKEWYSMRNPATSGALLLGLQRARAPSVEFPIAGARPVNSVYDANTKTLTLDYVGVATTTSTLRAGRVTRTIDTFAGVPGSVSVSVP